MNHIQPANPDDNTDGAHHQGNRQCGQPGALPNPLPGNIEGFFRNLGEIAAVVRLMIEGLYGFDLAEILPDITANIRHPVLTQSGQRPHPAAVKQDRRNHQRKSQQDDAGQLGVGDKQKNQPADKHQRVAQRDGDGGANHRLQYGGVSRKPGLNLQGPVLFKEAGREIDQVIEYPFANICHHPFANPGHQVESGKRTKGQAEYQHEKQADGFGEVVRRLRGQALIDQNAQALAQTKSDAGSNNQCHQCPYNRASIGTDKLDDKS